MKTPISVAIVARPQLSALEPLIRWLTGMNDRRTMSLAVSNLPTNVTTIMAEREIHSSNSFVTAAPKLDEEHRKLASAKLAAINEFYEARAKIARLNKELFDQGLIVGHDLMSW